MKKRLLDLKRSDIEQMFYHYFNYCKSCKLLIDHVPTSALIDIIRHEVTDKEIKEYLTFSNL